MPDLVNIQGDVDTLRGLTDIPTLQIIDESAKRLEGNQAVVSAFADDAAKTEAQNRGLTVTLIKTEAQYEAESQELFNAISDVPYDFSDSGGIA